MNKSGRFFALLLLSALALGLILTPAGRADAKMELIILEVTGILVEIDERADPPEITLDVDGEPASGALGEGCGFQDERGRQISMKDFAGRYVCKVVTLEIYEHNEEIISCRPGR